jgi:hypothetical protein
MKKFEVKVLHTYSITDSCIVEIEAEDVGEAGEKAVNEVQEGIIDAEWKFEDADGEGEFFVVCHIKPISSFSKENTWFGVEE